MRRILFFFFLSVSMMASAQSSRDLLISEIKGSVQRQVGKEKVEMKKGEHILGQDILIVGEGTTMILLEPRYCKSLHSQRPLYGHYSQLHPAQRTKLHEECHAEIHELPHFPSPPWS